MQTLRVKSLDRGEDEKENCISVKDGNNLVVTVELKTLARAVIMETVEKVASCPKSWTQYGTGILAIMLSIMLRWSNSFRC